MNTNDKYQQRQRDPGTPVPSVGRVVHYFAYGTPGGEFPAGVPRAAIITEVDEPGSTYSPVGLCVLNPTGIFFNQHIPRKQAPGGWDWTPYVAPIISSHAQASEQATPQGSIYVDDDYDEKGTEV